MIERGLPRALCIAALAMSLSSGASAQRSYPVQMEPAAEYSRCFYETARAAEPKARDAEDAIKKGFARCKKQRGRALSAVRDRMATLGIVADRAKLSSATMIKSMDDGMAQTLRQDFAKARAERQTGTNAKN